MPKIVLDPALALKTLALGKALAAALALFPPWCVRKRLSWPTLKLVIPTSRMKILTSMWEVGRFSKILF
jgi:hypothetical protein